jgi:hypothetical protein
LLAFLEYHFKCPATLNESSGRKSGPRWSAMHGWLEIASESDRQFMKVVLNRFTVISVCLASSCPWLPIHLDGHQKEFGS